MSLCARCCGVNTAKKKKKKKKETEDSTSSKDKSDRLNQLKRKNMELINRIHNLESDIIMKEGISDKKNDLYRKNNRDLKVRLDEMRLQNRFLQKKIDTLENEKRHMEDRLRLQRQTNEILLNKSNFEEDQVERKGRKEKENNEEEEAPSTNENFPIAASEDFNIEREDGASYHDKNGTEIKSTNDKKSK